MDKCYTNCSKDDVLDPTTLQVYIKSGSQCLARPNYDREVGAYSNLMNCKPEKDILVNFDIYVSPELIFQHKYFLSDYYNIHSMKQTTEWCLESLKKKVNIRTIVRVFNVGVVFFHDGDKVTNDEIMIFKNYYIMQQFLYSELNKDSVITIENIKKVMHKILTSDTYDSWADKYYFDNNFVYDVKTEFEKKIKSNNNAD